MLLAHYADILRRHLRAMVSTFTTPTLHFGCQRYASVLKNPQFPTLNMLHHTSVELHGLCMALLPGTDELTIDTGPAYSALY